ncbi:MAG: hypothetical protein JWO80_4120 [Bryobacterales bacterium]|nr:hypothetical protein [Bryobacterales bacterium]
MPSNEPAQDTSVLERGNIYFFYRPRVHPPGEEPPPRGLDDIERSYIVLHAKGRNMYRLILIGRKRLPDIGKREKEWAFVYKASRTPREIEEDLREQDYETKTQGERVRPAARPAGEGVYALVRHEDHTHLAYALSLPKTPGPVQKALQIEREASYVASVKNPEAPSPPEAGLPPEEAANYPEHLQEKFRGRRFLPVDPPELLDYPGAQILLVGASADIRSELGLDLHPERETERNAEIFRDLHLSKSEFKVEPLFEGKWD